VFAVEMTPSLKWRSALSISHIVISTIPSKLRNIFLALSIYCCTACLEAFIDKPISARFSNATAW
jgi:hypothetical protein